MKDDVMEIRKYRLNRDISVQIIRIPAKAKIISCQLHDGEPCIWAEVDLLAPLADRRFLVVGTGWELPEPREFIGTVQDPPYVWHLYALPLADTPAPPAPKAPEGIGILHYGIPVDVQAPREWTIGFDDSRDPECLVILSGPNTTIAEAMAGIIVREVTPPPAPEQKAKE